jgi:phosphonate transport system substrate-binding protein
MSDALRTTVTSGRGVFPERKITHAPINYQRSIPTMKKAGWYILILLAILVKLSVEPLLRSGSRELGSPQNPIKIMLTPSVEAHKVTASADSLVSFLHRATGYSFVASVPASFIVVVESFGSGGVDLAITNTFSYLKAHEKYDAHASMMVIRRNGERRYRGQIITHVDNPINSLADLNGKSFAYVDAVSTSGYVLPRALLQSQRIRLSDSVFAGKHDNVVTMVYQKQVDAGATYYSAPDPKTKEFLDARIRVRTQFPDVFDKVKILALTEEIPNDPVVFRSGFPADMEEKIKKALLDFQATEQGRKVLYATYSVEGLAPATDSDYDMLRALVRGFAIDVNSALSKKR